MSPTLPFASPTISLAVTNDAIARCLPVLVRSKASLTLGELLAQVERLKGTGYRLAVVEVDGHVGCMAGFRTRATLLGGKSLELDDLVLSSLPLARDYATALVAWLVSWGQAEGCGDMGVNVPHAHSDGLSLFLSQGFVSAGQHLRRPLR
jgi:hypothetical protein